MRRQIKLARGKIWLYYQSQFNEEKFKKWDWALHNRHNGGLGTRRPILKSKDSSSSSLRKYNESNFLPKLRLHRFWGNEEFDTHENDYTKPTIFSYKISVFISMPQRAPLQHSKKSYRVKRVKCLQRQKFFFMSLFVISKERVRSKMTIFSRVAYLSSKKSCQ